MKKKIVALLLISAMLFSSGVFTLAEEAKENKGKAFTLESAVEHALEHNNNIKILNIDIENIRMGGREADIDARRLRNASSHVGSMTVEGAALQAKQKELELEEALIQLENAKKSIEMGVARTYYGTIAAEENLHIQQVNYENTKNQYNITKLRYEVGQASKSDLIFAENSLKSAEIAVENAKSDVEKAKIALKQIIGMDLWQDVEIRGSFNKNALSKEEINLQEVIEAAYGTRLDSISARNMLKLAEEDLRVNSIQYTPNTYVYRQKARVVDMTSLRLEDTKTAIQQDIINKHIDLQSAARNIQEFTTIVANAEEGLRLNELSYEAGLATIYEVDQSRKQLLEAQLGLATAVHNYNIAVMDFEKATTIGD